MSGIEQDRQADGTAPLGEDFFRLRKRRNMAIALGLVAFMVLTFLFTLWKLSGTGAAS